MPRLLQINSTANWGSTGKIAEQIGERAIEHGWESYIAYGRYASKSKSHLIRVGSRLGQAWHLTISRLFDRHGLGSAWATKRLIKQIKRINPDIIHLHNLHGYYINYKLLFEYLNSTDTPVVWTLHDCWTFTGRCAYFDSVNCTRWQHGCGKCPALKLYPKTKIDFSAENFELKRKLFTAKHNIVLVPVSDWLKELVAQSMLKEHRCITIHNGIDIDSCKPTTIDSLPGTSNKHLILGVAAQWEERKGLVDFYKLREKLDANTYDITLIGLNDEQIANLPAGITGIRRTQNVSELAAYYTHASVFVNPTYSDNYPTTNLEAMACGTPVITYRTGGSPEALTPETGVVVEQGNIEALVEAIKATCSKGKEYYHNACRRRAEEHFDKQMCFEKYLELYNELLTKKQQ